MMCKEVIAVFFRRTIKKFQTMYSMAHCTDLWRCSVFSNCQIVLPYVCLWTYL